MAKKVTAYIFLIVANIILLAHAVLPHHQYCHQVCFESKLCIDDCVSNSHKMPEHNHEHENNANTATCLLNQALITLPSQSRLIKSCDNCSDHHNHDFYINTKFEYENSPLLAVVTVVTVPKFVSFLTSFVSSTLGLRAPPIV